MNILSVVYNAQILSNRSPSVDKSKVQQSSNGLTDIGRTVVDIQINGALLANAKKDELIRWDPIYDNSNSNEYMKLSITIRRLIKKLVEQAIPPGSDGGTFGKIILSKVNIPITESQVFDGVTAALSVSFLYPNVQNLNIDSIMDHLKSNYVRNSEISSLKIIQLQVNVTAENVEQTDSSQQPTTELRAVNTDGSSSSQNVLPEDGVTTDNVTGGGQQDEESTTQTETETISHSMPSPTEHPSTEVTAENVEQTDSSQQPTTELRAVNTEGSSSSQNVLPEDGVTTDNVTGGGQQDEESTTQTETETISHSMPSPTEHPSTEVTTENVEQTDSSQQPTTELRAVNTDGSSSSQNVLPEDGVTTDNVTGGGQQDEESTTQTETETISHSMSSPTEHPSTEVTAENVEQTDSSQQPTTELRAVNTDGSSSSQNVLPEDGVTTDNVTGGGQQDEESTTQTETETISHSMPSPTEHPSTEVTTENVEQTDSSQQPTTELRAVNTDGSSSSQNVLPEDGVTTDNVTGGGQQDEESTTQTETETISHSMPSPTEHPSTEVTTENVEQTDSSQQPTTELRAVNTDGSSSSQNVLPEDGASSHQNIVHSNHVLVAHYECQTSLNQSSNCESLSDTG
ncbi:unnamed protein product [Schistosoma bovis]|nr:unnamed protein product [Schistosoma bovis]